ncbi:peroxide stress protein YaaA [Pelomonas sp. KK5]|uniref:peroxide stress protein YaaA n=1 Tax=Pelomonas sp. KK5 TaxID=1855730 RepID=UPI00097C17B1|nr:peroxide stress protein YaaA [Pelomonas sp. KK5]
MLFLLSPAKSLDYETPVPDAVEALATEPQYVRQASELIKLLRLRSAEDIGALMDLSPALSELNVARYKAWRTKFTPANSRPAMLAFNGDVYDGLDARTLSLEDAQWAQAHVCILSGLYGLLRPLDRLQPYRLEMGTRLENPHGPSLYSYWGDRLALHLNKLAAADPVPVIVNLASQEYFKAADRKALKPRVIDCQFEDWKNGQYKIISFFAKRARGLMARFCVQQRISRPADLPGFDLDGYAHAPEASTPERLVFRRRLAD